MLIAPDSFKGTLAASGVARALARACEAQWPGVEVDLCPISDGGEGLLDVLSAPMRLTPRRTFIVPPQGQRASFEASWGISTTTPRIGVIEAAEAIGLGLTPEAERAPLDSTSHGLGELLRDALEQGVREVIIGLGGTGTIDGGVGAVAALGVTCLDASGDPLPTPLRGRDLESIASFVVPPGVRKMAERTSLRLAVDVTSPLLGPLGAAHLFGPQKGALPEDIDVLEANLAHVAKVLGVAPTTPGFGAAGGLGVAFVALLGASIESGISLVLDCVNFDERCAAADLVLCGEGALDEQSRLGKGACAVAERARTFGVESIAIVGRRRACFGNAAPFASIVSLSDQVGEAEAMCNPAAAIESLRLE